MNDSEQWLTEGDCLRCRRMKYCKKPCTKHKRRRDAILAQMTAQAMAKVIKRGG